MTGNKNTDELIREVDFAQYPIPVMDNTGFGKHISRFMRLLIESTFDKPNRVKIAFTGQSITDVNNSWPVSLTNWLRETYPSAEIVYQNFAIGGFSTQFLIKRTPNDMASFYPDLVVMYDKGDHNFYDEMIRYIRENTIAEIMIQTEHYVGEYDHSDEMSYIRLPVIAEKYNAQLCQIRTVWKDYTDSNALNPKVLLIDDGHLNDYGQTFMLELMKQFFVYDKTGTGEIREKIIPVSKTDWDLNKLTIPFTGNRIEVIAENGLMPLVNIKVDGKKPSETLEAYIRSAANAHDGISTRPGIIEYKKIPGEQTFIITMKSFTDETTFSYSAQSASGPEGESDQNGILDGNYLHLTDRSFIFHPGGEKPVPGKQFSFRSILNGTDTYDGTDSYVNDIEKHQLFDANMFISGIPVSDHVLELTAVDEVPDIKAIKVYCP